MDRVVIISVLIILAFFLICREIVCWYWKINEAVGLLKDIRDLLQSNEHNKELVFISGQITCRHCRTKNHRQNITCHGCGNKLEDVRA